MHRQIAATVIVCLTLFLIGNDRTKEEKEEAVDHPMMEAETTVAVEGEEMIHHLRNRTMFPRQRISRSRSRSRICPK